MKWKFRQMLQNEVESDITQRDQFRNDQLDLSDTVVREAVQNSLDAQDGNNQVKVRFAMVSDSNGMSRFLDECLAGESPCGTCAQDTALYCCCFLFG